VAENITRIDEFVDSNMVLSCDTETARQYGIVKDQLRNKGKPIPENDIWIAAIAIQHELGLVTRDAHFGEVSGLNLNIW
jgi:tRNA(fMet)-specific endonuclease VapC